MSFFLTGTDTGVGKTFCAIQLLRLGREAGLRCAGMKPICCGDRGDAERLLAASSEGLTIDELNPVWLKTPVAPFAATVRSIESHGARCAGIALNDLGMAADTATTTNRDILCRTVEVPLLTQVSGNRRKFPLIGDRCMPGNRTRPCQSQEHKCINPIH